MSKYLTRDEILTVSDITIREVDVPEWGGSVFVKGMTGTERDHFEMSIIRTNGKEANLNMENIRAKLAAQTVCDAEGTLLFKPSDIKHLTKKSAAALQRIFKVAQELSGLGDEEIQELAEGLEENFSEDSSSDLLDTSE